MKVEIVTLHRITNFGSMLQTYATQTAIRKLGYQTEVLDFVPIGMTFKRALFPPVDVPLGIQAIKFIPRLVCMVIEFQIMNSFITKYIKVSPLKYSCYQDILKNVPEADAYLSGSDQVWNTQNKNTDDDLKAYYLGFVPEGKQRIAYAGSFGKSHFTQSETEIIKEYIAKYSSVSVREDDGITMLEGLGFTKGVHVVDPTLLLNSVEWKQFASTANTPKKGYVFVYNLNRNRLVKDIATGIAKENHLRIINFADSFDFIPGAKNRVGNTALDFINHIANADYVVTDSFHGVAFSINLNIPFVCVRAPRYNSRLESILRMANLQERIVETRNAGVEVSNKTIDFNSVNGRMDSARKRSIDYLKEAITG